MVRIERSGREPVLAGEHLWQEPMGTIWQHSVTTAKNLLHHQASAGGTSILALSRSSLTACETPPGFSRWYFNFRAKQIIAHRLRDTTRLQPVVPQFSR